MTKRKELEAVLAAAEATLANAETIVTKIDEDRDKAIDNLEKARTHCRYAYVALTRHTRSELAA